MKYSHIVPTSLNAASDDASDLHLLLLHWAMSDSKYLSFYRRSKKYKILDNSFYELRSILPTHQIIKYAKELLVQEVVAPDDMYNYQRTKKLVEAFVKDFKPIKEERDIKIQAVVCGKTEKEVKQCYMDYINNPDIDVIAFSRRGYLFGGECHDDARFRLVKECLKLSRKKKPIHLLGANGISDYYRNWPKEVRSIDSKQIANAILGKWDLKQYVSPQQKLIFKMLTKTLKVKAN